MMCKKKKKIDTISTTIIFIRNQEIFVWAQLVWKISFHRSTQTNKSRLHRWRRCTEKPQLQSNRRVGVQEDALSRRMFRGGGGLGTSFNSTLLWKLQLPLSRLTPRPCPSALAPFATKTALAQLQVSLLMGFQIWSSSQTHGCMLAYVCTCASDLPTLYMHEEGTLKHLVKTKKITNWSDVNIFLSLHNQDYSKVYREAG